MPNNININIYRIVYLNIIFIMLYLAGKIGVKLIVSSVCLPHSTKYSDPLISMNRFALFIQHIEYTRHIWSTGIIGSGVKVYSFWCLYVDFKQ